MALSGKVLMLHGWEFHLIAPRHQAEGRGTTAHISLSARHHPLQGTFCFCGWDFDGCEGVAILIGSSDLTVVTFQAEAAMIPT